MQLDNLIILKAIYLNLIRMFAPKENTPDGVINILPDVTIFLLLPLLKLIEIHINE